MDFFEATREVLVAMSYDNIVEFDRLIAMLHQSNEAAVRVYFQGPPAGGMQDVVVSPIK